MTPDFNPYTDWLGIPREAQPANHYRLLGLKRFEPENATIAAAADKRLKLLRSHAAGAHAAEAKKLFREVAAAKECLLNAETRAAYDARLQAAAERLARSRQSGASPAPAVTRPAPAAAATPAAATLPATKTLPTAAPANGAAKNRARPAAVAAGPPPAPPPPPPAAPPPPPIAPLADETVAGFASLEDITSTVYAPRFATPSRAKSKTGAAKSSATMKAVGKGVASKSGAKGAAIKGAARNGRTQRGAAGSDEASSSGRKKLLIFSGAGLLVALVASLGVWMALSKAPDKTALASATAPDDKALDGKARASVSAADGLPDDKNDASDKNVSSNNAAANLRRRRRCAFRRGRRHGARLRRQ